LIDSQNEVGGWPTLNSLPSPQDSDQDGMPDNWEKANNLNPSNPDDRNDAGLVGDVRNNKRWKNMVNKILGGTGTISLGLLIKEIFRAIKPGG